MSTESMFTILIGTAIKSMAVLAAAFIVAFLMRGRSAASRHLVWIAAAVALLALPLLSTLMPQLQVPGTSVLISTPMFSATVTGTEASKTAPSAAIGSTQTTVTQTAVTQTASSLVNWRLALLVLWAAGAFLGFARMIAGSSAVWRARRNAKPLTDRALAVELAESLGIHRHVDFLESRAGSMPMTIGALHPALFMPSDASEWSEDRRRSVLLHELAHISRGDVALQLFARVAFILYWWNPLLWVASRELTKERERATDDLVLNAGTRASDYAGHLLEIARTARLTASMGWAAIAVARRSQLEGRLMAILDSDVNRKTRGRAGGWIAAAVAIALVAPLAALHAQDAQKQAIPADVDAYIRAANSQKNHEMLERAAKAAEDAQKYDTAQALLQSAAAIRATVSGDQSEQYAMGLMKLGDLEQKRRSVDSAAEFYTKAANILGSKPEAAPALMYLGTKATERKDFAAASVFFRRAQAADPTHAGLATMWMAIVKWHGGVGEEGAEALFKSALALQDPQSLDAANTMQVYARYLKTHEDREGAVELENRAEAIRKTVAQSGGVGFRSESIYSEAKGGYVQPTPSALPPGVYKIGGDVHQPFLIRKVEPEYSELARIAGFSGSVSLSVIVGTDGIPTNIQVRRPLGFGLDEKAVEAVGQWRFKPGVKGDTPVPVIAVIDVNFRLL
jgi:TonB family protein